MKTGHKLKSKSYIRHLLQVRNVSETRKMFELCTNYLFRNKKGQLKRQKNNISHTLFWHVAQLRTSKLSLDKYIKLRAKYPNKLSNIV